MDKNNPIRLRQKNGRNDRNETGSTPMSFNAGQSRREKYANADDDSLIDWDQSSAEQ
jgi:hypothetical protein